MSKQRGANEAKVDPFSASKLAAKMKVDKASENDDVEVIRFLLSDEGLAELNSVFVADLPGEPLSMMQLAVENKRFEIIPCLACIGQYFSLQRLGQQQSRGAVVRPYLSRRYGKSGSSPIQSAGFFADTTTLLLLGVLGGSATLDNANGDTARGDILISDRIPTPYHRAMAIKIVETLCERELNYLVDISDAAADSQTQRISTASFDRAVSAAGFRPATSIGFVARSAPRLPVVRPEDPVFDLPESWKPRHWQRLVHSTLTLSAKSRAQTERRERIVDAMVAAHPDLADFARRLRLRNLLYEWDAVRASAPAPEVTLELTDDDLKDFDGDGWTPAHWPLFTLMQLVEADLAKDSKGEHEAVATLCALLRANPSRIRDILELPIDAFECDPQGLIGNWTWRPPDSPVTFLLSIKQAFRISANWKRTTGSKFEYKGFAKRSFLQERVYFFTATEEADVVKREVDDLKVKDLAREVAAGKRVARIVNILPDYAEVSLTSTSSDSGEGGGVSTTTVLVRTHRLTLQPPRAASQDDEKRRPLTVEVLQADAAAFSVTIVIYSNATSGTGAQGEVSILSDGSARESGATMSIRFLRNNVLVSQFDAVPFAVKDVDELGSSAVRDMTFSDTRDTVDEALLQFGNAKEAFVKLQVLSLDTKKLGWDVQARTTTNATFDASFMRVFPTRRQRFFHWLASTNSVPLMEAVVQTLQRSKPETTEALLAMQGDGFDTPFTVCFHKAVLSKALLRRDDSTLPSMKSNPGGVHSTSMQRLNAYDVLLDFGCEVPKVGAQLRALFEDQCRVPVRYRSFLHDLREHTSLDEVMRVTSAVVAAGGGTPLKSDPIVVLLVSAAATADVALLRELIPLFADTAGTVTKEAADAQMRYNARSARIDDCVIPGIFALGEAARNGKLEVVQMLLKGGASAKSHNGTALWLAAKHRQFAVVELLAKSEDLSRHVAFSTAHPQAVAASKRPVPYDIPPLDEMRLFDRLGLFAQGYAASVLHNYSSWARADDPVTIATLNVLLDSPDTDFTALLDNDKFLKACDKYPMCRRAGELFAILVALYVKANLRDRKALKEQFAIGDVVCTKSDVEQLAFPFHFLMEKAVSPRPIMTKFWLSKPSSDAADTVADVVRRQLCFKLRPLLPNDATCHRWMNEGRTKVADRHVYDGSWELREGYTSPVFPFVHSRSGLAVPLRASAVGLVTLDRSAGMILNAELRYYCYVHPASDDQLVKVLNAADANAIAAANGENSAERDRIQRPASPGSRDRDLEFEFLRTGGFAYFDALFRLRDFKIVSVAASRQEAHLTLEGPFPLRQSAVAHLARRWQPCNLSGLDQMLSAQKCVWLSPDEHEHLRAETAIPHGGFAFAFIDRAGEQHLSYFILQQKDCGAFNKVQAAHLHLAAELAHYINKLNTTEFAIPPNLQAQYEFQQQIAINFPNREALSPGADRSKFVNVRALFPRLALWGLAFSTPLQLAVRMHQPAIVDAMINGVNRGIASVPSSAEVRPDLCDTLDEATKQLIATITYSRNRDIWVDEDLDPQQHANCMREAILLLQRPEHDFTYVPTATPRADGRVIDLFMEEMPVEQNGDAVYLRPDRKQGHTTPMIRFNRRNVVIAPLEYAFHGTPSPATLNPIAGRADLIAFIPPTHRRAPTAQHGKSAQEDANAQPVVVGVLAATPVQDEPIEEARHPIVRPEGRPGAQAIHGVGGGDEVGAFEPGAADARTHAEIHGDAENDDDDDEDNDAADGGPASDTRGAADALNDDDSSAPGHWGLDATIAQSMAIDEDMGATRRRQRARLKELNEIGAAGAGTNGARRAEPDSDSASPSSPPPRDRSRSIAASLVKADGDDDGNTVNVDFPLGGFVLFSERLEVVGIKRLTTDRRLRMWDGDQVRWQTAVEDVAELHAARRERESILQGTSLRLVGPHCIYSKAPSNLQAPVAVMWTYRDPKAAAAGDAYPLMAAGLRFEPVSDLAVAMSPPFGDYHEVAWVPCGAHLLTETPIPPCPFGGFAFRRRYGGPLGAANAGDHAAFVENCVVDIFVIAERPQVVDPWHISDVPAARERFRVVELLVEASLHPQEASSSDTRLWELTSLTKHFDRFGVFTGANRELDASNFCLLLQNRLFESVIRRFDLLQKAPYRARGFRLQEFMDASPENRVALLIPRDVMRTSGFRCEVIEDAGLSMAHWAALHNDEAFFRDICEPARFALDFWNARTDQKTLQWTALQFLSPLHYAAYVGAHHCLRLLLDPPPTVAFSYRDLVDGSPTYSESNAALRRLRGIGENDGALAASVSNGSGSAAALLRRHRVETLVMRSSSGILSGSRRNSGRDAVVAVQPGETVDELANATSSDAGSGGNTAPRGVDSGHDDGGDAATDAAELLNMRRLTPIGLAATFSHVEACETLVLYGADSTATFPVKVTFSTAHNSAAVTKLKAHRPSTAEATPYDIAAARFQVASELQRYDARACDGERQRKVVELLEESQTVRGMLNRQALAAFVRGSLHPFVIVLLGSIYMALLFANSSLSSVASDPYWAGSAVERHVGDLQLADVHTRQGVDEWWGRLVAMVDDPPSTEIFALGAIMVGVQQGTLGKCKWSIDAPLNCVDGERLLTPPTVHKWNGSTMEYFSTVTGRTFSARNMAWTAVPTSGNISLGPYASFSQAFLTPLTTAVMVHINHVAPSADRLVTHLTGFELLAAGTIVAGDTMYTLRPTFFPQNPGTQDVLRQAVEALIVVQLVILSFAFLMKIWQYALIADFRRQRVLVALLQVIVKQIFEQRWTVTLILNIVVSVSFNSVLRRAMSDIPDSINRALSDPSVHIDSFAAGVSMRYVRTSVALAIFISSFGVTSGLRFVPRLGPPAFAILRTVVAEEVIIFYILYFFYIVAIALVASTLYSDTIFQFRQFGPAIMSAFLQTAGAADDPTYDALNDVNTIAAPVFVIVVVVFAQLTFLNTLISVIGSEYTEQLERSRQWWFETIREQRRKQQAKAHGWPRDTSTPLRWVASWLYSQLAILWPKNYLYYRSFVTPNAEPPSLEPEFQLNRHRGKHYCNALAAGK